MSISTQPSLSDVNEDAEASKSTQMRSNNPREWPKTQKWVQILTMASFTMMGPMASSFPAPAIPQISTDLGIKSDVVSTMIVSVFIAGFAVGPLVIAPMCETYGRVNVLQCSNFFFFVFNLACGFVSTEAELLVFRLLAGVGGSGALSIGAGMIADCYAPEHRGMAMALYSLGPVLGPAIGPIIGSFIVVKSTWRWIFWSSSAFDALIALAGLIFMKESHLPTIQRREAKCSGTAGTELGEKLTTTPAHRGLSADSLIRPFKLMFTQPIVIVLSLYMGFVYGIIYIVLTSFANIYTNPAYYNEQLDIAGLHYIALTVGFFIGAQARGYLSDAVFNHLKAKANGKIRPEYRIPTIVIGAVLVPIGLLLYGWAAEKRVHWIATDIGGAIFTCGSMINFASVQAYIIDTYTINAASAMAAATVLRSLMGFALPLAGPHMYDRLGIGWGNTLLALICVALGIPAPIILWKFGQKLREMSEYATATES